MNLYHTRAIKNIGFLKRQKRTKKRKKEKKDGRKYPNKLFWGQGMLFF